MASASATSATSGTSTIGATSTAGTPNAAPGGEQCRAKLVAALRRIWEREWALPSSGPGARAAASKVGILLSGGVDSAAVLEAFVQALGGLRPAVALTVLCDSSATDRPYSAAIAAQHAPHGLRHVTIECAAQELLGAPLDLCVRALGTFDGMELRNSVVVARALGEAKRLGLEYVLTGDAADELLGGYSFSWSAPEPAWSLKRKELCAGWFFSAPVLAKALGLKLVSPFLDPDFVQWALTQGKAACVGELELEARPGDPRERRLTGKLPLRAAFPESLSARRRKDPIEVGSGSALLGANEGKFFENIIPSNEYAKEKARVAQDYRVVVRNAEHLYYLRRFLQAFPGALDSRVGAAGAAGATAPRTSAPALYDVLPPRPAVVIIGGGGGGGSNSSTTNNNNNKQLLDEACIACYFQLSSPTASFCRVCGAWPARRPSTSGPLA